MPTDRDALLRAAMLCDEIADRANGWASDRDNPDAQLDCAYADGAKACAKSIRAEAERIANPPAPEPEESDVPF